jgi:hypothetical protein
MIEPEFRTSEQGPNQLLTTLFGSIRSLLEVSHGGLDFFGLGLAAHDRLDRYGCLPRGIALGLEARD